MIEMELLKFSTSTITASTAMFIFVMLASMARAQVTEEQVKETHKKYEEMMKHDGKKRLLEVTSKNIEKMKKKYDIILIFFWMENPNPQERVEKPDRNMLEVVAQLMEGKKTAIATCEIMGNQKFAQDIDIRYSGMIKIFNRGKVFTYSGQRGADVIVPYLLKMLSPPVIEIKKGEQKIFSKVDLPKVIAYMEKDSKELREYAVSALSFQPMIPFYVVFDPKVAKSVHLKKLNSINFVRPYEKTLPFKQKVTESNLVQFIKLNRKMRFTKLRLENLHEFWDITLIGDLVFVFADTKYQDGKEFFSVGKSLTKRFEKNEKLTFVWVDPSEYPGMVNFWKKSFDIEPMKPAIGVVDIKKQLCAWLQKTGDEVVISLKEAEKWLARVVNKEIELKPMKNYTPPKPKKQNKEEEAEEVEDPEKKEEL